MSSSTSTLGSLRRLFALTAVFAMTLALLPAAALAQEARDLDGGVCDDPDSSFPDIASGETDQAAGCLADFGIAQGYPDGNYRPGEHISREQMASFLARKLEAANEYDTPETVPPAAYTDRAQIANVHLANVDMVTHVGIAEGKDDGSYDPGGNVTRAQMAAFIVRQIEEMTGEEMDRPETNNFDDSDVWAEDYIEKLGAAGISVGDGEGNFMPHAFTTRGQMALFIARDLDFLVEEHGFTFTSLIPPEEPTTNQTFAVSPQGTTVVQTQAGGQAVQYTASDLTPGATYQIALFPCGTRGDDATVKSDGMRYPNRNGESNDGIFTFRDQNLDDVADNRGSTQNGDAEILTVFFTPVNSQSTTGVANSDGEIDFRVGVDDVSDSDCAVPVVWRDAAGGTAGDLDLDDDSTDSWNEPAEEFAVGGAAVFHRGEAASGYSNDWREVIFLDVDGQYFVNEDGFQMFWGRAGDEYRYRQEGGGAFIISEARWEQYLSIGDEITNHGSGGGGVNSLPYNREGENRFLMASDTPGTPINVTAVVSGANDDEITVTWEYPAPLEGNINRFRAQLLDDTLTQVDTETTATVNTQTPTGPATTVTFTGVADGDYFVRVDARGWGDHRTGDWSLLSNEVTIGEPTTRPLIMEADLITDGGLVGIADAGDVWRLRFDQTMAASTATDGAFTVQDPDGRRFVADCATADYTCVLQAGPHGANSQLQVTINNDPTLTVGSDEPVYPLTIIGANADVANPSGDVVDLPNSPDRTIN